MIPPLSVRVRPFSDGSGKATKLLAFAELIIADAFIIKGIRVMKRECEADDDKETELAALLQAQPRLESVLCAGCRARGGEGAAREFCEFIMAAQGTLDAAQSAYL